MEKQGSFQRRARPFRRAGRPQAGAAATDEPITDERQLDNLIRRAAMNLLARREYTRQELLNRLLDRGFDPDRVHSQLQRLSEERLQCDERFAEAYLRSAINKGRGPLRIRQEMQQRGLPVELIDGSLATYSQEFWQGLAREVCRKKFGELSPTDRASQERCLRFLQYRGFSSQTCSSFLRA